MDPIQGDKKRQKEENVNSNKLVKKSIRFSSWPGRSTSVRGKSPVVKNDNTQNSGSLPAPFVLERFTIPGAVSSERVLSVAFSGTVTTWPSSETTSLYSTEESANTGFDGNQHLRNTIGREIIEDIINKIPIPSTSEQQNQETNINSSKAMKSIMKTDYSQSRRSSIQSSGQSSLGWDRTNETFGYPDDWDMNAHRDSLVLSMAQRGAPQFTPRSQRYSISSSGSQGGGHDSTNVIPLYPSRRPLTTPRGTRIELHVHLFGSVRPATLWDLMKEKRLKMPGDGSVKAIQKSMRINDPVDVYKYNDNTLLYLSAIAGDLYALERVAFELCEDKVQEGVLYCEVRYSPHDFIARRDVRGMVVKLKLHDVVGAVTRGFNMAEVELGITVRTILSIDTNNKLASDIFHVCQDFQEHGVVGINYHVPYQLDFQECDEVPLNHEGMKVFNKARNQGLHRTVHAGFLGGPNMVYRAIEKYHAERIGHGYTVVQDINLYNKCLARDIHFECCPWESILIANGPVLLGTTEHPITKFAEDNANFSLNTSHATITGMSLQKEYDLAITWGFSELHLVRSNIKALHSSFIEENEKKKLMISLMENLGITQRSVSTNPLE